MIFPINSFKNIKSVIKSVYCLYLNLLRKLPITSELLRIPQGFHRITKDYWSANSKQSSEQDQGKFSIVYPKIYAHRNYPKTIEHEIHWKFEIEYSHEHPETFVTVIPQGRVWGHNGTVITPDNKFLADLSFEIGIDISEHSIFKQWRLPNTHYIDGNVAVLSTAGGEGYFHWMFDVLPRIHLMEKSGIQLSYIDKFLVNSLNLSFQKETLAIIGIPEEKIIESCKFPHIKAKRLVVPSLAGQTGNIPKWACKFLKKEILGTHTIKIEKNNRIYISRNHAAIRRIINEKELVQFLTKLDFKVIFLEEMSVVEQVSVLNSASVIVSPHGAGLSNLVFAFPKTKVIELFSPNYVNVCYWILSNHMELDYYYLIGEGNRVSKYCDPHLMKEDILININSLEQLMIKAEVIYN